MKLAKNVASLLVLSCGVLAATSASAATGNCAAACISRLEQEHREKHPECDNTQIASDCCKGIAEVHEYTATGPDGQAVPGVSLICNGGSATASFISCVDARQDACDEEYEDDVVDEVEDCYNHCERTGEVTTEKERVKKNIKRQVIRGILGGSGFNY